LVTALFTAVLSTSFATPAFAVPLPGNPLTVHVGPKGQLQAFRAGGPSGIFFNSASLIGDAGFFLAFPAGVGNPAALEGEVFGFDGTAGPGGLEDYTEVNQSATTGSGTAADPLKQVTIYEAGGVQVTQTTTYVNGAQQFLVRWDVHNNGPPVRFKALAAADFYFEGDDAGTGVFTQGPPRFIGGTNADTGNSGGFEEVSGPGIPPWSQYQALAFPDVWTQRIQTAADSTSPTFDDSVVATAVDNAGGVEWDQKLAAPGLPTNGDQSFALSVRNAVPAALRLEPSNSGAPRGVPITLTATATDTSGTPFAGSTLRYAIIGANPGSGSLTLAPNGTAAITDPGAVAGGDTVVAFVDFNRDGIRQPVEPQASALATFVDSIAPSCTVKVSGTRVGGGGAGKPLSISITCNEAASVTARTVLTIPGARSRSSATADAAAKRRRRKKAVKIALKPVTTAVGAGQKVPLKLRIPRKVRRRYAGRRIIAKVTVRVADASANVKTIKRTRTVKLKKIKRKQIKRKRGK
jgi:hypothetical protein